MRRAASTARKSVEHVVARPGAEEAHAVREAEASRMPLERRSLGSVAEDEQLDARDPRDGVERVAERLLRRQPPGGAEREAADPERRPRLLS